MAVSHPSITKKKTKKTFSISTAFFVTLLPKELILNNSTLAKTWYL